MIIVVCVYGTVTHGTEKKAKCPINNILVLKGHCENCSWPVDGQ